MTQNRSRAKGDRFEVQVVHACQAGGIPAQRVPLSGAAGGMFGGDIQVETRAGRQKLECKSRARAWKDLYGWIEGNYALAIKRDRSEPLVVLRLSDFISLAKVDW